jgi:hypothetical protein
MGRFFQLLLPSLALLVVLIGLLLPPSLALADAPITRGPQSHHQGGTGATASGAGKLSHQRRRRLAWRPNAAAALYART